MKKVVFFCPYPPDEAPSQRFRFEQYLSILSEKNFKIKVLNFFNQWLWQRLYNNHNALVNYPIIAWLVAVQIIKCFHVIGADFVFIHREILPVGPPFLEWIIAKLLGKKVIYDFDDAIWLTDKHTEGFLMKVFRWRTKVKSICRWSYKVSAGNSYLADFARNVNEQVIINPTTIDMGKVHNKSLFPVVIPSSGSTHKIVIGWTGSHSTLKYLQELEPILVQIEEKYPQVSFLIIADRKPKLKLKRLTFRNWTKETEISDLLKLDIGIMPLPDDEWSKGKCGFKALQYMALEIPCVASSVGVNKSIIQNGINGILCISEQDWISAFDVLINKGELRGQMARNGRITVEKNYSVFSNTANFLSLFE